MNQSNYILRSYIYLFMLNKRKHLVNFNNERRTLLCYTVQVYMIRLSSQIYIGKKTCEEFVNEQLLLTLECDSNILNDVDRIHFPLYITIGEGHFYFFSVIIDDWIIIISDSLCK